MLTVSTSSARATDSFVAWAAYMMAAVEGSFIASMCLIWLAGVGGWVGSRGVLCSVCGSRFNLPAYYNVIKPIGQGAYGIVCKFSRLFLCCLSSTLSCSRILISPVKSLFHMLDDTDPDVRITTAMLSHRVGTRALLDWLMPVTLPCHSIVWMYVSRCNAMVYARASITKFT